jgi:type IV secretion system protein VirB10
VAQAVREQQQGTQAPPEQDAKKKRWKYLAQATEAPAQPSGQEGKNQEGKKQEGKKQGEKETAQGLINPARWAMPDKPLKTLYRSQLLPCRTLDAINSDIGGQASLELTVPIYDKFNYGQEILAKASKVIITIRKNPSYGATRLDIQVEQIEPPSGEVINLKASIADQDGAAGLPGKVNNHYGKLLLATGISAVLNIGAQSIAGTPGRGEFYENPAQSAARDLGHSVQRDAQPIIERELKLPPTITVKPQTLCSVSLLENVQFNRPPVVVR